MNIILAPVGSAGDVHPMVGLGLALKRRGHRITMVVNGYFQDLIERVGLEYVELGTKQEFMEFVANADLWHPTRSFPYIYNHGIAPTMRAQYDIIAQRQTAGDTMVISSCLGFGARIAHDKLGVPLATVHLQPAALWSEHESLDTHAKGAMSRPAAYGASKNEKSVSICCSRLRVFSTNARAA